MVRAENISKHFGELQALHQISMQVEKGELFGLIGPDGAGKTTLFRILTTLLLPGEGRAFMDGKDVVKDYRRIRRITGYMAGRFSLYQDLTVEENLQFFATVFGTSIRENYELIADIYSQIEPYKKRLAGRLSGGMKQKLALSCALIHKPKILVLDEPTTGVDAVSRQEFWEMLKRLQQKDITILVSTPYMDEAGLCDRIGLMQKGKLLAVDTPARIIEQNPERILAVSASEKYALLQALKNYAHTATAYAFGEAVHLTLAEGQTDTEALAAYLRSAGLSDFSIREIRPGIEDCFLQLLKEEGHGKGH